MIKKTMFCLLITGILVTVPLISACNGEKGTTTQQTKLVTTTTMLTTTTPTTSTQPLTTTTTPTTTTTTTQPPTKATTTTTTAAIGETLSEILGHAVDITSVKYDMEITAPGTPATTTKIWMKTNKMRSEMTFEGQTMITLLNVDNQTMYLYYPDQNMAIKMAYEQPESAMEEAQSIPDYNPTIIGTETLDGKVCLVVEYTVNGTTAKMWIWEEYGFPIRVETTTAEGTIIIVYKNIEFTDIPDNVFELPEGVQIMDIPGM